MKVFNIIIDPEGKNLLMHGIGEVHVNVIEGLFQKTMRLKRMKKGIHKSKMNKASDEVYGGGSRESQKLKSKSQSFKSKMSKRTHSKRSLMTGSTSMKDKRSQKEKDQDKKKK